MSNVRIPGKRNGLLVLLMGFCLIVGFGSAAAAQEYSLGDIPLDPKIYQEYLKVYPDKLRDSLPSAYDARDEGIVTSAKNQGACGSCWAFASVGAMESHILKGGGPLLNLSEQQQNSCNSSMSGCCGGSSSAPLFWVSTGPITEACGPYGDGGTGCPTESLVSCSSMASCEQQPYYVTNWHTVASLDFKTSCYNDGPSYWRFTVYSDFNTYWSSGSPGEVYVNTSSTVRGGHAVLLIGWDDAKGAYLLKNSWGATSGPNGDGTFWIAYSGHANSLSFGMSNFDVAIPCNDNDGDGYGFPGDWTCTYPEEDCDDSDPDVNPGAVEGPPDDPTCGDGLDNDCNGLSDEADGVCVHPLFGPAMSYATGDVSRSVVMTDLNDDGVPDLIVVNQGDDSVSILLGNGDGSFLSAVHHSVGSGPRSVAVGDLNDDGAPDMAVANEINDNVSILLGNGDGTFHNVGDYYISAGPSAVRMGDLDGNGTLDLAVATSGSWNVSVLLGNGYGSFIGPVTYGCLGTSVSLAIGELNGDNAPDLLVALQDNDGVSVLLGNGDGSFRSAGFNDAGAVPIWVTPQDLNNDTLQDVVVANFSWDNVSVLLGNGDGSLQAPVNYGAGDGAGSVAVGDLDGDGAADLAVSNIYSDDVSILLGYGDGTFQTSPRTYWTGSGPGSLVIGDLNKNGTLDLAVSNLYSDNVSVLMNTSEGICEDSDSDGYGDPGSTACTYPERDCDDANPDVNPGALEVCDGVDNNCAEGVDEEPGASASCDNDWYCDGEEYCESGVCQPGILVECGDGVGCTEDLCNEATDSCDNMADPGLCDNGYFCDGAETCDVVNDCQAGTPPVLDDGVSCTVDTCDELNDEVVHTPDPGLCDNGDFCDGAETCDVVNDCQAGGGDPCTPPLICNEDIDSCVGCLVDGDCDDGVGCTVDTCETGTGTCSNVPADALCDDGQWCNGTETCSAVADCLAGPDPCSDDGQFCNGTESCNEVDDQCLHSGDPCDDGNDCTEDLCIEVPGECQNLCNATGPTDSCCEDPACEGASICEAPPCNDSDGDGFGDPGSGSCPDPREDCDDSDPLTYPGAPEDVGLPDRNCNGNDNCFIATVTF